MSTELITAEQARVFAKVAGKFGERMHLAAATLTEGQAQIATTLDLAAVARIHDEVCTATEWAERCLETIAELCGPTPGPIAAALKAELVLGAQRYRHARDTIRALWRARNSALPQPSTLNSQPPQDHAS